MFPIVIRRSDDEFGRNKPLKPRKIKAPKTQNVRKAKMPIGLNASTRIPLPATTGRGGNNSGGGLINYNPGLNDNGGNPVVKTAPPAPTPPVAPGNRPQSWFAKLLDYGLTKESIRAGVETAKAQAFTSGQTISDDQALQQIAQQNGIGPGNSVGNQTGSALDGILKWVSDNIIVVAAVGLGVFLLFRQPPTGKRS